MKSVLFYPQSPLCYPESQVLLFFGESTVLESDGIVSTLLDGRMVTGPSWIVRSVNTN